MRWFGESWGAPINEAEHADTPGVPCERCGRPITDEDRGVILSSRREYRAEDYPLHLECFLEMVGVEAPPPGA